MANTKHMAALWGIPPNSSSEESKKRGRLGQSWSSIYLPQSKWPHYCSHGCVTHQISATTTTFSTFQKILLIIFPPIFKSRCLDHQKSDWPNGFQGSHYYGSSPLGSWLISAVSFKRIWDWKQHAQLAVLVLHINQSEFRVLIKASNKLLSVS